MRLSHKDIDILQRTLLALYEIRDTTTFKESLPGILLTAVPADYFYVFEFAFAPEPDRPRLVGTTDPARQITGEMAAFAHEKVLEHPVPRHFAQTGERCVLKLTDFQSVHQFRRTEIYNHFYRVLKIERQLAFPADFGSSTVGGITFGNKTNDFSERDRLMMDLISPHIEKAYRNACRWTAANRRSNDAERVLRFTRRETEIAGWLAMGKTNPEIALILGAKTRTVEKHMESILAKLGVENRTTAVVALLKLKQTRAKSR